jgi:hypothetical protein
LRFLTAGGTGSGSNAEATTGDGTPPVPPVSLAPDAIKVTVSGAAMGAANEFLQELGANSFNPGCIIGAGIVGGITGNMGYLGTKALSLAFPAVPDFSSKVANRLALGSYFASGACGAGR